MKFEKDVQKQEVMWENQHEHAAEKIYAMCSEMGGFFLKVFCLQTLHLSPLFLKWVVSLSFLG